MRLNGIYIIHGGVYVKPIPVSERPSPRKDPRDKREAGPLLFVDPHP